MTAFLQGVAEMHQANSSSARMLWVKPAVNVSLIGRDADTRSQDYTDLQSLVKRCCQSLLLNIVICSNGAYSSASLQAAFYAGTLTSWWLFMAVATAHRLSMPLSSF